MGATRQLAVLVATALSIAGCGNVSGLSELIFDLPPPQTGGAGGVGGAAGGMAGGHGGVGGIGGAGGEALPLCDTLDVQPTTVGPESNLQGHAPPIAWHDDRFAIIWQTNPSVSQFVTIDRAGGSLLSDLVYLDNGELPPVLAGNDAFFAFAAVDSSALRIFRYTKDATEDADVHIVSSPDSNGLITATPGAFLVTYPELVFGPFEERLHTAWLGNGTNMESAPVTFGTEVACCSDRYFRVARHADGFGVLWTQSSATTEKQYHSLDPNGAPTGSVVVIDGVGVGPPTFAASLNDNLLFGNCGNLWLLSPAGDVLQNASLPGGRCLVASTGSTLRWGQVDADGNLQWHALDPVDGVGEQLLSLQVGSDAVPAVAWDGSGFGVTWRRQDTSWQTYYAHIDTACPE